MERNTLQPLGPPPRRARFRPQIRNLRRTYRSIFLLIILVFGGWAVLDGMRLVELSYHAIPTAGVITKKEMITRPGVVRGNPGPRDYRLYYTFTMDDGTQIADAMASVPEEVYEASREGHPCMVVYLPGNPTVEHWLNDNAAARIYPRFMMICRSLIALIALVVLVAIDRPLRRELALARRGIAVPGQILATGKGKRRRARAWILYAFQTANGATLQGKCSIPRSTPAAARVPGTTIEVLHDPLRPRRNKARLGLDFVEFE